MFCKYCGNKLDPDNPVCSKCGKVASLNGGNGFWDLADAHHDGDTVCKENLREKDEEDKKNVSEKTQKMAVNSVIVSVVCSFLCIIVLFVVGVSCKKAIRESKTDCEVILNQQNALYEERLAQVEDIVDSLEVKLSESLEQQASVKVSWSPTPETRPVGYKSEVGMWLFRYEIEGAAISFQWEKQQENGEWVSLIFDVNGVDSRFGLKLDESLQQGVSKLVAVSLTSESNGIYKCTVTTNHGSESAEVALTIEPDSAISPTPSTTVEPETSSKPNTDIEPDEEKVTSQNTSLCGLNTGENPGGGYHG